MLINTVTPSEFPVEYQEVEWISSDSSWPYIDIWLRATNNTVAQIKLIPKVVSWWKLFWANWTSDNDDWRIFNYNSYIYWDCNSARTIGGAFYTNTLYEFEIWNNYVKNVWASSNIITWTTQWAFTTAYNIEINWDDGYSTRYYAKIYESWTLVRDLMPCYRKSDNVIWMLDKVNDVFYENTGTWTFTKWPDVN